MPKHHISKWKKKWWGDKSSLVLWDNWDSDGEPFWGVSILRSAWMKKRYWGPQHPTPDQRLAWLYRIHGTVMVVEKPTQGPHTRNPYVGAGGRRRRRRRKSRMIRRRKKISTVSLGTKLSSLACTSCLVLLNFTSTPTLQNASFYWGWLSKFILPAQ